MSHYVALLRGVNVGRGNRISMADFRALLTSLGYTDPQTLLNSGNAVFHAEETSSCEISQAIHQALKTQLGLSLAVIVKSQSEFSLIQAENPLLESLTHPSHFLVAFVQESSTLRELQAIQAFVIGQDQFVIAGHAAYLSCLDGISKSQAAGVLLGKLGKLATTRNWATVLKIAALLEAVA